MQVSRSCSNRVYTRAGLRTISYARQRFGRMIHVRCGELRCAYCEMMKRATQWTASKQHYAQLPPVHQFVANWRRKLLLQAEPLLFWKSREGPSPPSVQSTSLTYPKPSTLIHKQPPQVPTNNARSKRGCMLYMSKAQATQHTILTGCQ